MALGLTASSYDAAMVHSLSLSYALTGADCIDVAANGAIVHAARVEMAAASELSMQNDAPLLTVSVYDGSDPHFRKASFDATRRPTDAIDATGVRFEGYYRNGRCVPVCSLGLVIARDERRDVKYMRELFDSGSVDAVEIHTQVHGVILLRRFGCKSLKLS